MKSIRERILQLMKGPGYQPKNKSEVARALSVPSYERSKMRAEMNKMQREGILEMGKKSRYSLVGGSGESGGEKSGSKSRGSSGGKGLMVGVIKFQNTSGHAWFYPDVKNENNIALGLDVSVFDRVFVHGGDTGLALEGDRVSVKVKLPKKPEPEPPSKNYKGKKFKGKKSHGKGGKKSRNNRFENEAKGRVSEVLKRSSNALIGVFRVKGKLRYVDPEFVGFSKPLELVGKDLGAKSGQTVVCELVSWDDPRSAPVGKITKVLGWPDDPGVDIISVIHKYSLRGSFSSEVKKEAMDLLESLQDGPTDAKEGEENETIKIAKDELERREDWRDELVLTVDPFDAKDFDDAILVKRLEGGGYELAVHIADVSHYVKPHSELDAEAQIRGNSTYLVDRVLPMLPVQISNNICSLVSSADRLTKCAVITFDKNGQRTSSRFCDAVIHSKARLSYEQVQILLGLPLKGAEKIEKPEVSKEIVDALKLAWELASMLRKKRFADGALDLEFPEVKILLDENLKATGVQNVVHNESHQMVEECMLAANEAVAVALKMQRKKAIYRIHDDPDADRLNDFAEQARAQGFKVGDLTNKKHIQELIEKAKETPLEESIKLGLLKSLKRAEYSTDPLGHYGLAKMDYCHFTSPIRRYADLVVHRALQELLSNPPAKPDRNPKLADLDEIAEHISTTERKSAEAEMETKRMKMMEYLLTVVEDGDGPVFQAMVTDVRAMGLFVEISAMKVKGLVKVEDMPGEQHDKWRMEGLRYVSSSGAEIKLGAKVDVQIIKVDAERKLVDFRIVELEDE